MTNPKSSDNSFLHSSAGLCRYGSLVVASAMIMPCESCAGSHASSSSSSAAPAITASAAPTTDRGSEACQRIVTEAQRLQGDNKFVRAMHTLQAAAQECGADAAWKNQSQRLQAEIGVGSAKDPGAARSAWRKAMIVAQANDWGQAYELLQQAASLDTTFMPALVDAGLVSRRLGLAKESNRWMQRAAARLESTAGRESLAIDPQHVHMTPVITWTPDLRLVAMENGGEVSVLDAWTWHTRFHLADRVPLNAAIARVSPDGALVAIGHSSAGVSLWDIATAERWIDPEDNRDGTQDVAFSDDGALLAGAGGDGRVWVCEIGARRCDKKFAWFRGSVRRVAFSPNSKLLAASGMDGSVVIGDPITGTKNVDAHDHTDTVSGIAFSPDGSLLATASVDSTIRIRSTGRQEKSRILARHPGGAWRLSFHPTDSTLASDGADQSVRIWDIKSGRCIRSIDSRTPASLVARGDSLPESVTEDHRLASLLPVPVAGMGGGASAGSVAFLAEIGHGHDGTLWSLRPCNDRPGKVCIWDPLSGKPVHAFVSALDAPESMALDPQTSTLATVDLDDRVRIWNLGETSRPFETRRFDTRPLAVVAVDAGAQLVAAGSNSGELHLWNRRSNQVSTTAKAHTDGVMAVGFSPDGSRLATSAQADDVALWATPSLRRISTLADTGVSRLAWSSDGKRIVCAHSNGALTVHEIATRMQNSWKTASEMVEWEALAFASDGAMVAGVTRPWRIDGRPRVGMWDAASGREIASVETRTMQEAIDPFLNGLVGRLNDSGAVTPKWAGIQSDRRISGFVYAPAQDMLLAHQLISPLQIFVSGASSARMTLVRVSNTDAAIAHTDHGVELFGDEARAYAACAYGRSRWPLDVCEERWVQPGLFREALTAGK